MEKHELRFWSLMEKTSLIPLNTNSPENTMSDPLIWEGGKNKRKINLNLLSHSIKHFKK